METRMPFDIVLNINNQLTSGYHYIKVKIIDSNGLESNIFQSQKFLINPPPSPIIPYPTKSSIPLIRTLTYTIIDGVRTQFYTYVLSISIGKTERERAHGFAMTPAILITLATISFFVVFAIAYLGLALYRRVHAPDDPSSSDSSTDVEIGKQCSVTIVADYQENIVLDEEMKKNFKQEDLDYMFNTEF